ncbi:MAG: hypothetical protein HY335_01645 [Deinococcus sp.]|nr:hypothetical protein [Deinococcus sp.]
MRAVWITALLAAFTPSLAQGGPGQLPFSLGPALTYQVTTQVLEQAPGQPLLAFTLGHRLTVQVLGSDPERGTLLREQLDAVTLSGAGANAASAAAALPAVTRTVVQTPDGSRQTLNVEGLDRLQAQLFFRFPLDQRSQLIAQQLSGLLLGGLTDQPLPSAPLAPGQSVRTVSETTTQLPFVGGAVTVRRSALTVARPSPVGTRLDTILRLEQLTGPGGVVNPSAPRTTIAIQATFGADGQLLTRRDVLATTPGADSRRRSVTATVERQ